MATTRSLGTTLTPAFTAPVQLYAAGDDLSQQYLRYAGSFNTLASTVSSTALADALDMTIKTNHRPLGQRGSHRPAITARAQFVQEDGRVATIALKTEIVFENGMSALSSGSTERVTNVVQFAAYVRALNAMVQQALLNPTGVENPDINANITAFMNGIILAGA